MRRNNSFSIVTIRGEDRTSFGLASVSVPVLLDRYSSKPRRVYNLLFLI